MENAKHNLRFVASTAPRACAIMVTAIFAMVVSTCLSADAAEIAKVGLDGHYRVGKWIGIRIDSNQIQALGLQADSTMVETRDGESVRVRYGGETRGDGPSKSNKSIGISSMRP